MITKNGPKALVFDIETAPKEAYVWGIRDVNISLNQIIKDTNIIAWAAKWLDEPSSSIMYQDLRDYKDKRNDKPILKKLHALLSEADIVITQNGKHFDEKVANTRFLVHGFKPVPSYRSIDTYRIATKKFAFTSNKLEYMTNLLNRQYKKLLHDKYPGFELWRACLNGDKKVWKEMEKYNKWDVLSTEELYKILYPWDPTINFNVYMLEKSPEQCHCGHDKFRRNGFKYTSIGKFPRWACKKCGSESRSRANDLSKERRKGLKAMG